MDIRIIQYYAGELSEEERKALLQEIFFNQELKKEMLNYHQLQALMNLHPQQKNGLLGRESLRSFMQALQAEKGKRLFLHLLRYAAIIVVCVASTWWITFSLVGTDRGSLPFIVSTGKVDVKALGIQFNRCYYLQKEQKIRKK